MAALLAKPNARYLESVLTLCSRTICDVIEARRHHPSLRQTDESETAEYLEYWWLTASVRSNACLRLTVRDMITFGLVSLALLALSFEQISPTSAALLLNKCH